MLAVAYLCVRKQFFGAKINLPKQKQLYALITIIYFEKIIRKDNTVFFIIGFASMVLVLRFLKLSNEN